MRNHRTTADLQRIVGSDRGQSSARLVADAERELLLRAGSEETAFARKVRLSANACIGIGGFCLVWPGLMLLVFGAGQNQGSPPTGPTGPFLFRHFDDIFVGVGVLQAICGLLLLLGGLATRVRRSIGPTLISVVLGIAALYLVAFTLASIQAVTIGPAVFVGFFLGFMAVNDALFLFLLWLPFRFFRSPRVREFCRSAA
jgi:hypothetical protein